MGSGNNSFGRMLKWQRVRLGMTQQELAERAGLSVRTVRYLEQDGIRHPRPDSLRRLATAVGLDPEGWPPERPVASTTPGSQLRLGILGPLTAQLDGNPVLIRTAKQRCLLAVLSLHANQVVSWEEIVHGLWADRPPHTYRALVHTYVSRLRKALRPGRGRSADDELIAAVPAGYRIALTADQLDLRRFDELVASARRNMAETPEAAVDLFTEALGLWRGPVLADLPDQVRLQGAVRAISGRRTATTLDYADAAMAVGRHQQVSTYLRPLAEEEPLHEGLHARLMLALAGAGQQAAALEVFDRLRARLAEDLGVSPSPELQHAQLRVLRQNIAEPAVVAAHRAARPAQLPVAVAGFTGRHEYLDRLDALLANAADETVIAAISGTAGVGKTALAVCWGHRAAERFPDGQLYLDLRGHDPAPPVPPLDALAQFLRALGVPADRIPAEGDEAAGLFRTMLAGRRMLVVLDNAANVDQVRPLLPGGSGCMTVVTSRDRLDGLVARDGAHRVPLDVLDRDEASELLTNLVGAELGRAEPEAAGELAKACAYLPLALRIAAADLLGRPEHSLAERVAELRSASGLSALRLDGDDQAAVRAAFDLSYRRFDADVCEVFRLLGLVPGPDFTVEAVARLADTTEDAAASILARLSAAHLIQQHAAGRYTFHDLLRLYAAELPSADRTDEDGQAALRRLYDWYLHSVSSAARLLYPENFLLPQRVAAGPAPAGFADSAGALAWLDAERANLVAAVQRAAKEGPRAIAWQLAAALRGYFLLRMHTTDWQTVTNAGLAAAEAEGQVRGQAACHHSLAQLHIRRNYHKTVEHAGKALRLSRQAGWVSGQVVALEHLSFADWRSGRLAKAAERATDALTLNQHTGWRGGQITSMCLLGLVYLERGRLHRAVTHFVGTLDLSREVGSQYGQAFSLTWLGQAYRELGEHEEAREHLAQALSLHERVGGRTVEPHTFRNLAAVYKRRKEFPEALRLAEKARVLALEIGDPHAEADAVNTLGTVHADLGRHREAFDTHRQALKLARRTGYRFCEISALIGLAIGNLHLGRREEALADAELALTGAVHTGYRILEAKARDTVRTIRDRP